MPTRGVCPHLQGLPGRQVVEVVHHVILIRPLARVGGAPASAPFPGAGLRLVAPAPQRGQFRRTHSQASMMYSSPLRAWLRRQFASMLRCCVISMRQGTRVAYPARRSMPPPVPGT